MLPADWLRPFEGRFGREVPLAPFTTWRLGGPAGLLLEPESVDELVAMARALWRSGVPCRLLGGGSNLLVSDRGVRGAVLSLRRMLLLICVALNRFIGFKMMLNAIQTRGNCSCHSQVRIGICRAYTVFNPL